MEKLSGVTKPSNVDLNLENSKKKELNIDKQNKLKIIYNDKNILFNITQNAIPLKEYELLLSLEQLYNINRFFLNFDNIDEIVNCLINSLKEKKSNINFNDNKCNIHILNQITNKAFDLSLNLKENDINTRMGYLENIIIEQNNKINVLEEKMKQFEQMFDEYKKNKEQENFIPNSDILNYEEKELLIKWLPNKPRKLTLLMNSNIDGDTTKNFLNKCKDKCPTLSIIKTTNGYKFGGYTTQLWKEGQIKDNEAFVFSLNKKKKYNIIKPETAVGFGIDSWWGFGIFDNAIVVLDKCTSSNDNWVGNKTYNIQEEFELNGGNRNFTVKSFEVYFVDY